MPSTVADTPVMTVEKARPEDIPRLCELLTVLFMQETEFRPDVAKQETALSQIMNDERIGNILVLRDEAEVRGMVSVLYTVSTALGGRVGLVEDVVVHPDWRNRGWGSLLLREATRFALAAGCLRLTVLTDTENHSAIRFYERHGFETSSMKPLRLLPADPFSGRSRQ